MDTVKMMSFPIPVARLIASDLNQGDKAREELKNMEKLMILKEKELSAKDSIVVQLNKKSEIQNLLIQTSNEKYDIMEKNYRFVSEELNKERKNKKFNRIVTTALIGALTTILIFK